MGVETIGERVRKLRAKRGISRRALAEAADMSYTSLADLENGYQMSTTKLHKLAHELRVTPDELEKGLRETAHKGPQTLTERETSLLEKFRNATPDGKRAIEGAAAGVTTPRQN